MRKKLLSIAILLTTSSSLFAAEAYNPQKITPPQNKYSLMVIFLKLSGG